MKASGRGEVSIYIRTYMHPLPTRQLVVLTRVLEGHLSQLEQPITEREYFRLYSLPCIVSTCYVYVL